MASLKEKFDTAMTDAQKNFAKLYTQKLVSDLVESNINFNVHYWQIGSYTVIVPQNDGYDAGFYISDRARLYHGNTLIYEASYTEFDYNEMIDLFVAL